MNELLLFAKYPRAGAVKTRLAPPLSLWSAAQLYSAFLRDMILDLADGSSHFRTRVLASSESDLTGFRVLLRRWFPSGIPDNVQLDIQQGAGLGDRLAHGFRTGFESGAERVCALGADHPIVRLEDVVEAFRQLDTKNAVIGPAIDGGYYLVGMQTTMHDLFSGMPWSHTDLLSATIDRIEREGLTFSVLPVKYDVDTIEDVQRLYADRHSLRSDSMTRILIERHTDHFTSEQRS